jgi:hypothetical protein
MDSNERELLAAVELLLGCVNFLRNNVFTLHECGYDTRKRVI